MAVPQLVIASPATLAELVSRLPAEARAQVAWAPKRVADVAKALLTEPILTDGLIEKSADGYLEAVRALSPAILGLAAHGADFRTALQTSLENDLKLLSTLPPAIAKAALRATVTVMLVGQLGAQALASVDLNALQRAVAELDSELPHQHVSLLRTVALVMALLDGLKRGSPIPGRVAALARRADAAAREFATFLATDDPALRLPWYDASAPNATAVSFFAIWNPDNRLALRGPAEQPPSQEELDAWERVKEGVDSARPHRKVFT